jgi:hypothetical protein
MSEEPSQQLVDDLIYYFVEKKRLSRKNYEYVPTIKWGAYFREAAAICNQYEMTAAGYIQRMYDRMEGKKEFFTPEHIRGGNIVKMLEHDKTSGEETYKVEITNSTLDYSDVWKYQHELAMRYIRRGETVESVLMDSSLKFFAWYRILSTPRPYPEVINKYKHIAKKEMTSGLRKFAEQEGLDLERLLP